MAQFARLFEFDGDQFLVFCDENKKGDPVIVAMVTPEGLCAAKMEFGYGPAKNDASWEKRNEAFDSMDDARARRTFESMRAACERATE